MLRVAPAEAVGCGRAGDADGDAVADTDGSDDADGVTTPPTPPVADVRATVEGPADAVGVASAEQPTIAKPISRLESTAPTGRTADRPEER